MSGFDFRADMNARIATELRRIAKEFGMTPEQVLETCSTYLTAAREARAPIERKGGFGIKPVSGLPGISYGVRPVPSEPVAPPPPKPKR